MEPKLLVVDDEHALAATIADYFGARGFRVDVAHELEEAQALVINDTFDVVVTDLRLTPTQHEEGLELLRFVRHRAPRTFIVVLTAYLTPDAERVARERGACLVLQKPQLLAELERHLRSIVCGCGLRTASLCTPLLEAAQDDGDSDELKLLSRCLQAVSEGREDAENAASLQEVQRVIEQVAASGNTSLAERLSICLSGSAALQRALRATARQPEAAARAQDVIAGIQHLRTLGAEGYR